MHRPIKMPLGERFGVLFFYLKNIVLFKERILLRNTCDDL